MTAKFDAKRARENMWVTHQNLARAKGGHPGYQFKERKAHVQPPRPIRAVVAPEASSVEPAAAPSAVPAPASKPRD